MWDLKEYRFASSPAEAVALLRRGPGKGAYIAGGTDILRDLPDCDFVVDVNHAGIATIDVNPDGDIFLGAAAHLAAVAEHPVVRAHAEGILARTAGECGRRASRPTATVGGHLCQGSRHGGLAPALLALDARCVIADEDSTETITVHEFFADAAATVLADRLLVGLILPGWSALRRCLVYRHTRFAEGRAIVQVAVGLDLVEGRLATVRIALASVAPRPMRATLAEAVLTGLAPDEITPDLVRECADMAAAETTPPDDHRASAEYRRDMVRVLTRRLLMRALAWQDDFEAGTSA